MPKLPQVSAKRFIRALTKLGFYRYSRGGSGHIMFAHPDGRKVVVAVHSGFIPRGTLSSMLKDINLSIEEFANLL